MTVAAVILAASADSALADAAGVARVRRIADAAWAGGAMPIIVVAEDPEGRVAAALAGAPVTLAAPAPLKGGPAAQIARGVDLARTEISGTAAALVWPARLCWAGPETVTSLIEAHGVDPDALLRPIFGETVGWPALLPVAALPAFRVLSPTSMPDDLLAQLATSQAMEVRLLDLGDPGTVIDGETTRDELPPYDGPPGPLSGHAHEWGSTIPDDPDAAPHAGHATVRLERDPA